MTESHTQTQWLIARDDAETDPAVQFLTEDQKWGPIDEAMIFETEAEATNGAETLCPPFMPGHPIPTTGAVPRKAIDTEPVAGE